jgi:Family of unknown function (DUF6941)
MEIDAFLADSVQAAGGKLHALGIGWQVIQVGAFPVRHDRVGLGLVVRTTAEEAGQHTLSVALLDPSGAARPFGDRPSFEAGFASPDGEGTATLALNLDGLVFDAEGTHVFVLGIDGSEAVRLPFRVQTRPEPPPSEFRTGVYL